MREINFEQILEGFDPNAPVVEPIRSGAPVTIWLSARDKARYDRLQEMSKKKSTRRFSSAARDVLKALIDAAEKRAS